MKSRGAVTKVGCLVSLVLIAAAFYFALPAGRAYWRYMQYKNAMRDEIRFRADLSDAQLRSRLQAIADSLGLPEDAGFVTIARERRLLTIRASYEESWKLPGYEKLIHFEPRASGPY